MKNYKKYRKTSLCVAISSLLVGFASTKLQAQEAETKEEKKDDYEVIQVVARGFADSLGLALNAKRMSSGSVDTIMAEDIADFPDQNLADSLQRIPGVAISRSNGEGSTITVRGLNSSFTRTHLNGMQTQSIIGGTSTRTFQFNTFASELFNRLEVHKTTNASMDEGSLGATVGLYTARPFDYAEDVFAVNVQGSYSSESGDTSPRTSAVVSWTNDDDTFGAVFSAAYSERSVYSDAPNTGRWEDDVLSTCTACADGDPANQPPAGYWHPRFPRYVFGESDLERTGLTSSFQWIPTDSTQLTLDILYSENNTNTFGPALTPIGLARTGSTGLQQSDWARLDVVDSADTIIVGAIADTDIRSEYVSSQAEGDFNQVTLNLEQEITDDFNMTVLLGKSNSEGYSNYDSLIYEHFSDNDERKNITYADNSATVGWDFTDMLNPVIDYSFDLTNPANWEVSELRNDVTNSEAETRTAKVDFNYFLFDELSIAFGYADELYAMDVYRERRNNPYNIDNACGVSPAVTAADGSVQTYINDTYFVADHAAYVKVRDAGCFPFSDVDGSIRNAEENSASYYVQANFNAELGDMVLRGDAGVRHVKTDLASTGILSGETVTVNHEYSNTLPSVNLALEPNEELVLRASWAKVMSRPGLGNISPAGSITTFGEPKVNSGNPFLAPFKADTIDLTAEWYFAEGALVSIAYFQKDIESFPETITTVRNWQDLGLDDSLLGAQVGDLKDADFEVNRLEDGAGGDLDGIEIQYQQPLTFLPGPEWMKKFGVIANLTFVDSEISYGTDRKGPLTGQADESANFTLYWEDDVFSARISAAYRGEYYSNLGSSDSEKWRTIDPTTNIDISLGYQVSEQLSLNLEAINITKETEIQWMDGRLIDINNGQGMTVQFGVSYKM
ncbi:MAG: TonB-dependent receptor [Paraglaciecola sp.]|uniref:TonB-dependent receptor n=1 Tax=Paraglaciecola sp. TaxID=1920173 RepID=UPI0032976F02